MEINYMPDEVLLMIFEKLPAHTLFVAPVLVCRRWRNLIKSQILVLRDRRQLKISHSKITVILIIRRMPSLHKPTQFLRRADYMAPCLRELTIHCKLPLDEIDYDILNMNLENLRHLDVFSKSYVLNRFTVPPLGIESLVVNDHMAVGFLPALCQGHRIRRFQMYGRSLHYKPSEMVNMISTHSAHLTELTLRCNEMTDARYRVLRECGALRSLRLYSCWLLSSQGVQHLTALPGLRCLHLTGARMVRQRALAVLVAGLPPLLVELNLSSSWFGSEHCAALAQRLPALRRLELWRVRLEAAALLSLVAQLPRLEALDTDLQLSEIHLNQVLSSAALSELRCCVPRGWKSDGSLGVQVVQANDPPVVALRGDGDGPSANSFYLWADCGFGPRLCSRHFRPI